MALREAEAISLFLKDYRRPGDRVLAPSGSVPLAYYLRRQGGPLFYFARDLGNGNKNRHLVVVLNEAQSVRQTLGGVLDSVGWTPRKGEIGVILRQDDTRRRTSCLLRRWRHTGPDASDGPLPL